MLTEYNDYINNMLNNYYLSLVKMELLIEQTLIYQA